VLDVIKADSLDSIRLSRIRLAYPFEAAVIAALAMKNGWWSARRAEN
jgi:hypothetical protein